ncbi:THO complex subunit 4B-like protein, partial [Drosera capensis]
GSAEVVYGRRSDAFAALRRYNNVQLDGRPMKIEILSPNSEAPLMPVLTQAVGGTRLSGPVNRSAG